MPEERGSQDNREQPPQQDYYQASRFAQEHHEALDTYEQLQALLLDSPDVDLSTYRFLFNQVSYVAILGQQPPDEIEAQVIGLLAAGETAAVPDNVLKVLRDRRAHLSRQAPWVEGHYRPGKPMGDR